MRANIRRTAVAIVAAFGIVTAAACSANDGTHTDYSEPIESTEELPTEDETFEPEASLVSSPPPLDAESAEPTQETTPSKPQPTPEVESDVAREADLVPCEETLGLSVIDTTVPGTSKVYLDEVVVDKPNVYEKYSETCRYVLSGTDNRVANVTSILLTVKGKEFYRNACSGDEKYSDVNVKPIGYQYYRNIDDGCTLTVKDNAPAGTLPGFVLRYRDRMVIVRLAGFNTVENDGEAVIRETTPKS